MDWSWTGPPIRCQRPTLPSCCPLMPPRMHLPDFCIAAALYCCRASNCRHSRPVRGPLISWILYCCRIHWPPPRSVSCSRIPSSCWGSGPLSPCCCSRCAGHLALGQPRVLHIHFIHEGRRLYAVHILVVLHAHFQTIFLKFLINIGKFHNYVFMLTICVIIFLNLVIKLFDTHWGSFRNDYLQNFQFYKIFRVLKTDNGYEWKKGVGVGYFRKTP